MDAKFEYNAFSSYSARGNPVVLPLAKRLRKVGVKGWFDECAVRPGGSIPARIEEGHQRARVLMPYMPASAFSSDRPQLESSTFRFGDPLNNERHVLPCASTAPPSEASFGTTFHSTHL